MRDRYGQAWVPAALPEAWTADLLCFQEPGNNGKPVENSLAFTRALLRSPLLSIFARNPTTWEVLLMLAAAPGSGQPGSEGPGLYEIIAAVETRALGSSALLRFLRERRDEGSILFTRSNHKQSKWSLSLRPDLHAELLELLRQRDGGGGR